MRLDNYLKVSRLIKRRTVANEACDEGRVLVNDKPAKASVSVKAGDIIEIQFGSRNVKVEVLDVKDPVWKPKCKGGSAGCKRDCEKRRGGEPLPLPLRKVYFPDVIHTITYRNAGKARVLIGRKESSGSPHRGN